MDEFIATVAENNRFLGALVVRWQADGLRVRLGLVEVIAPEDAQIPQDRFTVHEGNYFFVRDI